MTKKPIKETENKKARIDYKWKLKEVYDINNKFIESHLLNLLKQKKLIPDDKSFSLAPDFFNVEDWKISLNKECLIEDGEMLCISTTITQMKGQMFIVKDQIVKLDPSFGFEYNFEDKTLRLGTRTIKKAIEARTEKDDWTKIEVEINNYKPEIFNKKKATTENKFIEEAKDALTGKQLGFSENAANSMILAAMNHESFKEDMNLEQFIGLTFRMGN